MGLHTSQAETHKKLKLYICVYCKKLVICLKQIKNLHLKFHVKVPQKFRDCWKDFGKETARPGEERAESQPQSSADKCMGSPIHSKEGGKKSLSKRDVNRTMEIK